MQLAVVSLLRQFPPAVDSKFQWRGTQDVPQSLVKLADAVRSWQGWEQRQGFVRQLTALRMMGRFAVT